MKLEIDNKNKIKDIKILHPEYMSEDIKEQISSKYYDLLETQNKLYALRNEVTKVEKELEKKKKDFEFLNNSCEIEFEKIDKEYTTQKSDIGFKGLIYTYK